MPLRDAAAPVAMARIAIVTPGSRLRETLVAVAGAGTVQLDVSASAPQPQLDELQRHAGGAAASAKPALAASLTDVTAISGHNDLVSGEVQLLERASAGVTHGAATILLGWTPQDALADLENAIAGSGASLVALPRPAWQVPPTLLPPTPAGTGSFRPLMAAYGTVPYADIDPTLFAAVAFVLMFGAMFADLGHGLLVVVAGLLLRRSRRASLRWAQPSWPILVACGVSAAVFGAVYGEAFGPTGLIPALWLQPLDSPLSVLIAGIAVGAGLLLLSALIGAINRWREGGLHALLLAPTGLSAVLLVAGPGVSVLGILTRSGAAIDGGVAALIAGAVLLFAGLILETGRGWGGLAEAVVELFDLLVRAGANTISFARLAAFGLMHAAISLVVWQGTVANLSGLRLLLGVLIFAAGTAVALTLEALVAGVQALRLEYCELFSRIFAGEGRPFVAWKLPVVDIKEVAA